MTRDEITKKLNQIGEGFAALQSIIPPRRNAALALPARSTISSTRQFPKVPSQVDRIMGDLLCIYCGEASAVHGGLFCVTCRNLPVGVRNEMILLWEKHYDSNR